MLEVVVLLGGHGVFVAGFPAVPRALDIVPFQYFFLGVEDVGHDDEVAPADLVALDVLFDELVQAVELGDHGVRILLQVVVVALEDRPQELVLAVLDCLEHVLPISRVVEEGAALALAREGSHRIHFSHHQRSHQPVRTDRSDVLFVVDVENLADVVERVGSVVGEGVDGRVVVLVPEAAGNELEVILEAEVFGLLIDHLLEALDAPDCHLDADHHI